MKTKREMARRKRKRINNLVLLFFSCKHLKVIYSHRHAYPQLGENSLMVF